MSTMNFGPLTPFAETLTELAGSKKSTIFLASLVGLAYADQVGFAGVPAKYRLAAAVFLVGVWIVAQCATDISIAMTEKPEKPKA